MKMNLFVQDVFVTLMLMIVPSRSRDTNDTMNFSRVNGVKRACPMALAVPLLNDDIEARYENGSLLHEGLLYTSTLYWHENNVTYGCACEIQPNCVRKCCPNGKVLSNNAECIDPGNSTIPDLAPASHQLADDIRNMSKLIDRFYLVKNRLCPAGIVFALEPNRFNEDKFVLQSNGTLVTTGVALPQWKYCIDHNEDLATITVLVCHDPQNETNSPDDIIYPIGIVISIPFLVATLVVYAIIPELKNLYGMTLMCYVASLIVAYSFLAGGRLVYQGQLLCVVIAFIIHFSFLSSFFWLNVMCFDIWWTFGGFRSMQGSVKQRERKKFIFYSIYAWGSASLLTGVCVIMDFVPSIPKSFIRPEFGVESCWFSNNAARALYFYGPIGVTVICNIFLFISTTMKIIQHKKDTAHHLKGMDSRRHDDNKQWFNLYLKLFIVMGINWSMEIISWLFNGTPHYFWYITDLANTLQGLIIFIIFVWKDKTKRLLLKRLGFKDTNFQSHNSTRSAYHSSASRTCTSTLTPVTAPLQEKSNPFAERTKITTDESDCV